MADSQPADAPISPAAHPPTVTTDGGRALEWIVLAMTSGVLGNATYDALKTILRRRRREAGPAELSRDEAIDVARLTLGAYFQRSGTTGPDPASIAVSAGAAPDNTGVWHIGFMMAGRSIHLKIPPGEVIDHDVEVFDSPSVPAPRRYRPARVTVNLSPRAASALDRMVALTGDSQTDVINRALLAYAYLREEGADEHTDVTLQRPDGSSERISFVW